MSVVECMRVSASAATTLTLASPADAQSIQHPLPPAAPRTLHHPPDTERRSPVRQNALATLWRGLAARSWRLAELNSNPPLSFPRGGFERRISLTPPPPYPPDSATVPHRQPLCPS